MSNSTYTTQDVVTIHVRVAMMMRKESQADLARILGCHPSGISSRFAGRVQWSLDELDVLAEHYGVEVGALVADAPEWMGQAADARVPALDRLEHRRAAKRRITHQYQPSRLALAA